MIAARGKSSAASAANAAIDAMRALYTPTPKGEWFTTAIIAEKNGYGIEESIVFGFPCTSRGDGNCEIVRGLNWDPFVREKIALTQKELLDEKAMVKELL